MALLTVYSILQRSRDERRWMQQTADATERVAVALEALVAKLNEPPAEVPPELHDAIDETATAAAELKTATERQGA